MFILDFAEVKESGSIVYSTINTDFPYVEKSRVKSVQGS